VSDLFSVTLTPAVPAYLASVGPTTPKRATARASKLPPGASGSWLMPARNDGCDRSGRDLRHSIETRNQIHACLALQWHQTEDETPLERRFGRRHEDRRQVWWLSPDDRNWLRFPDRYQVAFPVLPAAAACLTMRRHGAKNADCRGGVTCFYDTQLLGACLHASGCGGRYRPGAVRGMPDVPVAPSATGPNTVRHEICARGLA